MRSLVFKDILILSQRQCLSHGKIVHNIVDKALLLFDNEVVLFHAFFATDYGFLPNNKTTI